MESRYSSSESRLNTDTSAPGWELALVLEQVSESQSALALRLVQASGLRLVPELG